MHISQAQDAPNNILTKCTKMKEEHEAVHGMNGNSDVNIKEECPKNNYVQGGRLKFFKDGKFILELERAREGERVSWVSVPRKTFWPPQGTAASTPTYRQESSTSLSVSDDNSSIQSSPWQRDHSWKQTNPRRGLSKELQMMFWRPVKQRIHWRRSRKRRRPYSSEIDQLASPSGKKRTGVKKDTQPVKGAVLLSIVQNLIDKTFRTSTPPRSEIVVSPRKRFLREMEKDRAQVEDNCLKRSRSKPQAGNTPSRTPPTPVTPNSVKSDSPQQHLNGNDVPDGKGGGGSTTTSRSNCSYSITSLLAEDRGERSKRGEAINSPSHYASSPLAQHHYTPPPDDRWYSESVDKLRSIELSQHVDKRGYHSPHPPPTAVFPPPPHPHHSSHYFTHSYVYPYQMPSIYGPSAYTRGVYSLPPAIYHPIQPPHPTVAAAPPPPTWITAAGGPQQPLREGPERRDEHIADMPLNLSKHAG